MDGDDRTDRRGTLADGWHNLPRALMATGGLLFAAHAVGKVSLLGLDDVLVPAQVFGFVVNGTVDLAVAGGGYALARSAIERSRYRRVGLWCLGGFVVYLALNVVLMTIFPQDSLDGNLGWALFAAGTGLAGGLLIGGMEARSIQRAVVAERRAVEAEAEEERRQWLEYINGLLRHEILNNVTVIQGSADLLLGAVDDESSVRRLETIRRRSEDMTQVVRDVRVLLDATGREDRFEPVDLESTLRAELIDVRDTHGEVETDLAVPDSVAVRADDLLARVFGNLLANAVEHNDGPRPRVDVTVTTDEETVRVRVADDGPGIPERERESLFERSNGDHGLGLYLVRVLVRRYGGSIELTETGPEGSVVTVELPRADADADADDGDRAREREPAPGSELPTFPAGVAARGDGDGDGENRDGGQDRDTVQARASGDDGGEVVRPHDD